jgi:hypothetical protein
MKKHLRRLFLFSIILFFSSVFSNNIKADISQSCFVVCQHGCYLVCQIAPCESGTN